MTTAAKVTGAEKPDKSPPADGDGKPPGEASDLGAGFVAGVLAAVREQQPEGADAHVAGAVALGWYVAALAHEGPLSRGAAATRGDLMTIAALSDAQVAEFCLSQVQVAFTKLAALVEKAALDLPSLDALKACLAQDPARQAAAAELDAKALAVLSAVDSRLGKAYGLGRAVLNLTTRPAGDATLAAQLAAEHVAPVAAALDDMSSALPPHAGHSVRASLYQWQVSVGPNSEVARETETTWHQLARQGELWRSLLSGEKAGTDMLEIDDYVEAADRLAKRFRSVALHVLRRFWGVALLIVVLFAGGVVLALVATDASAAVVAGAGTILASFGLTWNSIGRTLGQLTGKLERPLWGAELDTAITAAITLLAREDAGRRDTSRHRREVAVALGAARAERDGG
jgi:hypothetical protein